MEDWSSERPENSFECEVLDALCASHLSGIVMSGIIVPRTNSTNNLFRLPDEHDILVFMDGLLYTLDMKELNPGIYRGDENDAQYSDTGGSWSLLPRRLSPYSTAFKKLRIMESFYRTEFGQKTSVPVFVGGVVVPDHANVQQMTRSDGSLKSGARILLSQISRLESVLGGDSSMTNSKRPSAEEMAENFRSRPEALGSRLPCQVDEHLRLEQFITRRPWPIPHMVYRGFNDQFRVPVRVEMLRTDNGDMNHSDARRAYRSCLIALQELRSPAIPRFYSPLELHNTWLIVSEFFSTTTLQQMAVEERMPWDKLKIIFSALVEALREAHKSGIIHRHVNPNCILMDGGEIPDIRLGGFFGAAVQNFSMVQDASFGNPYRAPEYHNERQWRTPMEDAYGVGRCLCAVLSGNPRVIPINGAPHQILELLNYLVHEEPAKRSTAWKDLATLLT